MTRLRWLVFELSSDSDERVTLDAMASVSLANWPDLQAEVCQILGWLHREHGALQGAHEEGGAWDVHLTGSIERAHDVTFEFVKTVAQLRGTLETGERVRHTLSICLSVAPWLAEALDGEFGTGAL